jgi:FkbM family methyltransferase
MKTRDLRVALDIISQSRDGVFTKIKFFFAFLFHYGGKFFGININFFPKMNLDLRGIIFQTREKTIDFWMVWDKYEKEIMGELDKLEEKGTFVDAGANIGRYSLLMAKKDWEVYSFEPVKSNFFRLKNHLKNNSLIKKTKIFNLALGDKKEEKNIYFEKHKHGEASLLKKNKNIQKEKIKIEKMDNLLINKEIKKPVVLKIDVEGFEYKVLLGAKKFIKEYKPKIIIELWNKNKDIKFLNKMGYQNKGNLWIYKP